MCCMHFSTLIYAIRLLILWHVSSGLLWSLLCSLHLNSSLLHIRHTFNFGAKGLTRDSSVLV
jgi:hypothetical protein